MYRLAFVDSTKIDALPRRLGHTIGQSRVRYKVTTEKKQFAAKLQSNSISNSTDLSLGIRFLPATVSDTEFVLVKMTTPYGTQSGTYSCP